MGPPRANQMETLIFDTAAVLNFGHRGELTHLLKHLSGCYTLLTTPGVIAELTDPKRKIYYNHLVAESFTVKNATACPFDIPTLARLSQTMDSGEIAVLALAKAVKATAVLDDRAARRQATLLGIQITGTLGLLSFAVTSKWITESECLERVHHLCNASFTIPRPTPTQTLAHYLKTA